MKKVKNVVMLAVIIFVGCLLIGLFAESQTKFFQRMYDDLVMDNKNHYLSCNQLPQLSEVNKIVEEHQDLIQAIRQVNPGLAGVEIDSWTCPGKADIVVWYASHQDRISIEKIIDAETFFGIPYRLQNR